MIDNRHTLIPALELMHPLKALYSTPFTLMKLQSICSCACIHLICFAVTMQFSYTSLCFHTKLQISAFVIVSLWHKKRGENGYTKYSISVSTIWCPLSHSQLHHRKLWILARIYRHLRTRRALLLYKVYGNNTLLALTDDMLPKHLSR